MKKEKDVSNTVIVEENGLQIIRSVSADYDSFSGEFTGGHKKVYYDVCDGIDILDTFKTLREAKSFLKNY